jgi:hypothetical protein
MKKSILTILIIVVLAFLFWLITNSNEPAQTPQLTSQKSEPSVEVNEPAAEGDDAIHEKIAKLTRPEQIPEENWSRALKAFEIGLRSNVPIKFYARVVDQYGNGIEGVLVQGVTRGFDENILSKLTPGKESQTRDRFEVFTDQSGFFSLTDRKGSGLSVEQISKEGYEANKDVQLNFPFSRNSSDNTVTSADKPIIYRMWKKGESEPLIKYEKDFKLIADGRIYTIDLRKGKKYEGESTTGDLQIKLRQHSKFPSDTRFNWSFSIKAPNGGLRETNDSFLYQAPEDGYQSDFELVMEASDPSWTGMTAPRKFYIRSSNGFYSGVEISIYVYGDNNGRLVVNALVNPSGSRNLEYDPAKAIKP